MAENYNQPKSPMDTENKTAKPKKGDQAKPLLEESVSGLDVRQLLGLGRPDPDPVPAPVTEAVEIELPNPDAPRRQVREEPQPRASIEEPVVDNPIENRVVSPRNEAQKTDDVRVEQPPRPSSPSPRPSRPAFDATPARQERTPEPPGEPPAQPQSGASSGEALASTSRRPIPPVTDPSELSSLRPSIDPLAANAPLAAARPVVESASETSSPQAPDPSIAANAKLEELASLSERTLEDYETFDDFDDTSPQRSKKTPVIILASLLCVGVLAGGVVFAYRQGVKESSQTTLPIIVAETTSAKEEPSNPGGVKIPHQNKLIYDRILGEETDIAERIVPREEKVVPFSQQQAHTTLTKTIPPKIKAVPPIKAVVPPVPDAPVKPVSGETPAPANDIKKVVVDELAKKLASVTPPKPVSPPDSLINGNVIAPEVTTPEITKPVTETLKLPAKNLGQDPVKKAGEIVRLETETVTAAPEQPATAPTPPPEPSPEKLAIIKLVEETVGETPEVAVKAKVPPILPRRKPAAPSSTEPSRIASATTPAVSAPSTAARASVGGYVIQIAAFRSQEEALSRYTKLKRRHSSLLKPYTSFVQRADLGDRGVYYRLRLGPIDGKDNASNLCRSLLSAGEKDCLVRSR